MKSRKAKLVVLLVAGTAMAMEVQAQGELEISFGNGQYGDSGLGTLTLSGAILVSPVNGSILETVSQGSFTVNPGGLLPAETYNVVPLPGDPPAAWPASWPVASFPGGSFNYYDQTTYGSPHPDVVMGLLFADANYFMPGNGPATGLELWEQNGSCYLAAMGPGISFDEQGALTFAPVAAREPNFLGLSALGLLGLVLIRRKFFKMAQKM